MKSVQIGDVTFKLLFDDDERPYTPAEMAELEESIQKFGVLEPVVSWQEERKVGEEESIVVGATRAKVVAKLGLGKIPVKLRSFKSKEDAREFNRQTSIRRHYTAEEQQVRRAARIGRVVEARQGGQSIRTIAETENVSTATVQRDLDTAATVTGDTVTPQGGNIVGANGSNYTAPPPKPPLLFCEACQRKQRVHQELPKKCEECTALRKPKTEPEPEEPKPLLDEIEQEVPESLQAVFEKAAEFQEIVKTLNAVGRQLKELSQHPAGAMVRLQQSEIDLKNLKRTVRFDMPYCVCCVCQGTEKGRKDNCPCKGKGWLNEASYKLLPMEMRP